MQVLKFGGTSVASPENITKIKNILAGYSGKQIIVVSAFGGVTDELINASELAKQQDTSYKIVLNKIESRHLETIKILIPVTNQSKVLSTVKKPKRYCQSN
jgi:aspartokinase/homoserine dehydrogenase 1